MPLNLLYCEWTVVYHPWEVYVIIVSTTRDGRRCVARNDGHYVRRLGSYRPRRAQDKFYDIPRGFASEVKHLPLIGNAALAQLRAEYGIE